MRIYAGIDEAGYGPLLGPMTIACTEWSTDEALGKWPDLWKELSSAVCKRPTDHKGRIAIDDSKTLKGAKEAKTHPLRHLERGVLSTLAAMTRPVRDQETELFPLLESNLLKLLGCGPADALPWHKELSTTLLPVATTADELRVAANRLHLAFMESGARMLRNRCTIIEPEELNEFAKVTGSKSAVSELALLRLLCELREKYMDAELCVACDRQSGRTRYLQPLQRAFPEAMIRIHEENDRQSRYQVIDGKQNMFISFETESEQRHLPVALASMTAKYMRELSMRRMNAFFRHVIPGIVPTAGYVEDGRRFLEVIRPHLTALGLEIDRLVRKC